MTPTERFKEDMRAVGWPEWIFAKDSELTPHQRDVRDAAYTGWDAALKSAGISAFVPRETLGDEGDTGGCSGQK